MTYLQKSWLSVIVLFFAVMCYFVFTQDKILQYQATILSMLFLTFLASVIYAQFTRSQDGLIAAIVFSITPVCLLLFSLYSKPGQEYAGFIIFEPILLVILLLLAVFKNSFLNGRFAPDKNKTKNTNEVGEHENIIGITLGFIFIQFFLLYFIGNTGLLVSWIVTVFYISNVGFDISE